MDGLQDAIARLEGENFGEWNAPARLEALRAAAQLRSRFEALFLRLTAACLADGLWETEGAPSLKAWLAGAGSMRSSQAAAVVQAAHVVERHAPVSDALAAGTISAAHVR